MSGQDPLLPKAVVVGIAIVVSAVWAITAVAVIFFRPDQSGALVAVSAMMSMVLGAALGISPGLLKRNHTPPPPPVEEPTEKKGETP